MQALWKGYVETTSVHVICVKDAANVKNTHLQ